MVLEIKYVPTVIEGLETLDQNCQGFLIQMREKGTTAPVREKIAQAIKVGSKWKSEAVVFEETINGKTYEFRGAVMGKGKLLSIFSLWALFACSMTEPEDISYLGDAVKQNVIWTLSKQDLTQGGIITLDLTLSANFTNYGTKAAFLYPHDNDNARIIIDGYLETNTGAITAYATVMLWDMSAGQINETLWQEEKTETTQAGNPVQWVLDLSTLNLTDGEVYEFAIRMKTGDSGSVAYLRSVIAYAIGF